MRRQLATLFLSISFLGACTGLREADERARREQGVRDDYVTELRQRASRISVTPGDIAGGGYDILGTVEHDGTECATDILQRKAVAAYGGVDALIGYRTWNDSSQPHCAAKAVRLNNKGPKD